VLARRTQDPDYWRTFVPGSEDLAYIYDLVVETGRPMATTELARAAVYRRVHQERERMRELLERGRFYRPADAYEEGEEIIFPTLDFAAGVVVGRREGHWPGHAPFRVIAVRFDDSTREFASELSEPHVLNESGERGDDLSEGLSPATAYERFGASVPEALERALNGQSERGFVLFGHRWFLRSLMPDVHIGYLNLAEAVVEVSWEAAGAGGGWQRPFPTDEILSQIDLQGAHSHEVARFALELALSSDERFVDVGSEGEPRWLLRRLVPDHVTEVPPRLKYVPIPFSIEAIPTEALNLIWAIPDELSTMASAGAQAEERRTLDVVLTYPHARAGTLPVTAAMAAILPKREDGVSVITLVDEGNDERLTAWVSHSNRCISSLREWYDRQQVPAGAFITLTRTGKPDVYTIACRAKRRTQREYVRVDIVEGDKLTFEIRRQPMAIEFDETMVMLDDNSESTDRLWRRATSSRRAVSELLREVFSELAKLTPQGTVHFNTLYTAINVLRRCPPEPILAELALDWRYIGVGSGYYAMDERVAV